jgi:predicted murein hydrolase (TIGR00659 family)
MPQLLHAFYSQPLFGVAVTVIPYAVARMVERRHPNVHVLLSTSGSLILLLLLARIRYDDYNRGGSIVSFFLGPATVALAVPLYDHAKRIGRSLLPLLAGVTAGAATSMAVGCGVARLLGGSRVTVLSMVPRGCTTPIAMDVAAQLGGNPQLTAVLTAVSGLLGSLVGPWLLRQIKVTDDLPLGVALGTASHGIGTARALRTSETAGAAAAVSMTIAGLLTAVAGIALRHALPK